MGVVNDLTVAVLALLCGARAATQSPQGPWSDGGVGDSTVPPPYLHLPVFLHSRSPLIDMERFSPAAGGGLEQIPPSIRKVLIPASPSATALSGSAASVTTACERSKMRVEVRRGVVDAAEGPARLRLGTCEASHSSKHFIIFEYDLSQCGTKRAIKNNQVFYSNTLQFETARPTGPIRRTVPFTLPVSCAYNRYYYSYKIGYAPKMQVQKIVKPMKNRAEFLLTPRNAKWEQLSLSEPYILGKPMYFQAEVSSVLGGRLYIHSCYATPKKSPNSSPQFPVVTDFGCMVESREGHSRFIPSKDNMARFTLDAFLFKGMTGQQLYMHCSMSMGSTAPSITSKACNYDTVNGRWVELTGLDSVCDCCNSNCSSPRISVSKVISSRPLTVESKVRSTAMNRGTVLISASKSKPPSFSKTMTRRTKGRPGTTKDAAGQMVTELVQPLLRGGVIVKSLEEMSVKGSAVVEENNEEVVTELQRTFEDFFALVDESDS